MIKELKQLGYTFQDTDSDLDFIDSNIIEFKDKECCLIVSEFDGCFLIFKGGVKPKQIQIETLHDLIVVLNALRITHDLKANLELW